MLELSGFQSMIAGAAGELAPNRVCAYIYDLSNAFNRFTMKRRSWRRRMRRGRPV